MAGSPGGREVGRLSIRVLPNTSGFAAQLQRDLDRIERRAHIKVNILPDLGDFSARLRADLDRVAARSKLKVQVVPDVTRAFRDDLRARLSANMPTVAVKLKIAPGEVMRLRRELATIRPPLVVPVRMDVNSAGLNNARRGVGALAGDAAGAERSFAGLVGTVGKFASLAGALPSLAGLVGSLAQMAPAAAVAVPAMLAMGSAVATIKIGTSGVSDALKGDADAMAKLAPAAQSFVKATQALGPAWRAVQQSVQGRLFAGLGDSMTTMARAALPTLNTGLGATATSLNAMARSTAGAVTELAKSGQLASVLGKVGTSLGNLKDVPGKVLAGVVAIGNAAAPAFDKLTAGVGKGVDALSAKLSGMFASGAMTGTINAAVALVQQFAGTIGNILRTVGNVFGPAVTAGAGFLSVLSQLTATAARLTATPQAQATFTALFTTLAAIGHVVSGVLGAALAALLPLLSAVVQALAGPLQSAVAVIGPALSKLAGQLGAALAPVVASLSSALAVLLPIVATLVAQLAGALGPVLVQVGGLIGQIVTLAMGALGPILAQLPSLLAPLLLVAAQLIGIVVKLASQLLTALTPALTKIGAAFGQLLVATAPLLQSLGQLVVALLSALMPVLLPIISLIGQLASILAGVLAKYITSFVVPALTAVSDLLSGNFSGAWAAAKQAVSGWFSFVVGVFGKLGGVVAHGVNEAIGWLAGMGGRALSALSTFGAYVLSKATQAASSLGTAIGHGVTSAVSWLAGLPGRALSALGDVGSTLMHAGASLLDGFISGITSKVGELKSTLGNITSKLTDWKGPAPLDARILTPNGKLVMGGFMRGIRSQVPTLRAQLSGITTDLPRWVGASAVYSPTVPVAAGSRATAAPAVRIDNFHAGDMTPAQVARELAWQMKARG